MNTGSTPFLHLICYNNAKIRFYKGERKRWRKRLIHAAPSYFPEESRLLSIRWSNARRRGQGILYARDLIEIARHDLEQNSN